MVQLIIQERHFLLLFVQTKPSQKKSIITDNYEETIESPQSDSS